MRNFRNFPKNHGQTAYADESIVTIHKPSAYLNLTLPKTMTFLIKVT